jgi:hypothetical protein
MKVVKLMASGTYRDRLVLVHTYNGSTIPISSGKKTSAAHIGGTTQDDNIIGEIQQWEFFIQEATDSSSITLRKIWFYHKSGYLAQGYIDPASQNDGTSVGTLWKSWSGYQALFHQKKVVGTYLADFTAANKATINGGSYNVFTAQKAADVYRDDYSFVETVPVGGRIATISSVPGGTYPMRMLCYAYSRTSTGQWFAPSGGANYWVDLKLGSGSMPSNRTLI